MAKKKDYNVVEIHNKIFTIVERAREESDVRMIPYTIKAYVDEIDNGEIRRDALIERTDDQWTRKQKSKLIEAILHNRPIGSIALAKGRAESKSYTITSLVDGLQRTTAIVEFVHDKYALSKNARPIVCRCIDEEGNEEKIEIEIAGLKYSELPDALKDFFNKYRLTTYIHEGFTDDELDDMVFCMNNGKTPNAYQKMRFILGSDNMRYLQPICDSDLWLDSKGCKSKNDSILCCVIRTLMMMTHYNYTNLSSATMTKFVDNDFEEYVKRSTIGKLANLVEELNEIKENLTGEEAKHFDSTTIPHYILGLESFNMNNQGDKCFIDFLRDFWKSDCYKSFVEHSVANGSGSHLYSADNVVNRQYDIYDYIDEYLDIAENDNGDDNYGTEKEESIHKETRAESSYVGDAGIETLTDRTTNEPNTVQEISGSGGQTGIFRQEEQEDSDNISRCEQTIASA